MSKVTMQLHMIKQSATASTDSGDCDNNEGTLTKILLRTAPKMKAKF